MGFCWLSFLFHFDPIFVFPSRNSKLARMRSSYALVWSFHFISFSLIFHSMPCIKCLDGGIFVCFEYSVGFLLTWEGDDEPFPKWSNLIRIMLLVLARAKARKTDPSPFVWMICSFSPLLFWVLYNPVIIECFHVQFAMMTLVRSSSTDLIMGAWYLHMPKIPLNWAKLSFSLLLKVFLCSTPRFVHIMEPQGVLLISS